ncbi:MAG: ankyrin repeat domain-containing protein [Alphaproteobacteria bacterium]
MNTLITNIENFEIESINKDSNGKQQYIINCIACGDIETLKLLIKEKGIKRKNDAMDWTYLHYAAFHGNIEAGKLLLNAGLNIDALDKNYETPLFIAISNEKPEMVDFLIKNNANLFIKNVYDFTPIRYAKLRDYFIHDEQIKQHTTKIINLLESAIKHNDGKNMLLNNVNEKTR